MQYLAQDFEVNFPGNTQITQRRNELTRDIENASIWLIERRLQQAFGFGYNVVQKSHIQFYISSGFAVNQELSTEGIQSGSLWEVPVTLNLKLYQFQNPNLQLSTMQTVYFGLTEKGRIRSDGSNLGLFSA